MKKKLTSAIKSLNKLPERKHYVEFITAALSIPVLITVILVNLNNLKANKPANTTPTPSAAPKEIIIRENNPITVKDVAPTQATTSAKQDVCKKEVGPISIDYPKEGATITDNPVNVIIKYTDDSYCSVVWSYRINNGSWSEYSSNAPSIYNMPNGNVTFDLRVQSTASQDQDQLERKFNYNGGSQVTSPTITTSPTPTQQ